MRDSQPEQLPVLTSLRGIAALAVMLYHFRYPDTLDLDLRPYTYLLANCYLMVDLFFILSGFILMHVYRSVFREATSAANWASFLWARFARVYPLHAFTLAVLVVFYWARTTAPGLLSLPDEGHFSAGALLHNLFLTQGPWLPNPTWNSPAWSISAEAHAYLLFPLLCAWSSRQKLWEIALFCGMALVLLFAIGTISLNIHGGPFLFLRFLPEFAAGIFLYRLHEAGVAEPFLRRDAAFGVFAIGVLLAMHTDANDAVAVACFGGLIMAGAAGRGRVARILAGQPFAWLGDISYSVYLCHMPIRYMAVATLAWWGWPPEGRSIWQASALLLVLLPTVLVSATLTYRYIEVPARRWLRTFGKTRPEAFS